MARYIDADMFEEQLRLNYCKNCNSYNGVRCRSCEIDDALDFIEDAPTADVAPKSDVAMEIFEDIKDAYYDCIWIDITTRKGYLQETKFLLKLVEIKKKYTEEKT